MSSYSSSGLRPTIRLNSQKTEPPILDIQTHFTRKLSFTHRDTKKSFLWSYERTRAVEGGKARVLALWVKTGGQNGDHLIAQMVRSRASRTPGTKSTSTGNGGRLVLEKDAADYLEEELIVATCLAILKREAHRRRVNQATTLCVGVAV